MTDSKRIFVDDRKNEAPSNTALTALIVIGAGALVIGVFLFAIGTSSYEATGLVGFAVPLVGFGAFAVLLALVASAIIAGVAGALRGVREGERVRRAEDRADKGQPHA